MPLDHVSLVNPYNPAETVDGWAYCRLAAFDFGAKTGRLIFEVYASKSAAYSGAEVLRTVEFVLGAVETPAVYGPVELVSPGTPAVYGDPDPETGVAPLITPAADPVYSTPSLLRPGLPGLPELIAANQQAYALLAAAVDSLAASQPEFAGAVVEP